jgi:hypothetical protein
MAMNPYSGRWEERSLNITKYWQRSDVIGCYLRGDLHTAFPLVADLQPLLNFLSFCLFNELHVLSSYFTRAA